MSNASPSPSSTSSRHEIERIRRSVAMLPPGQKALSREDAMAMLRQLDAAEGRLEKLRHAISDVLDAGN